MNGFTAVATLFVLGSHGPALAAVHGAGAGPFATCEEQFQAAPLDYEPSYCFFEAAQEGRRWHQAEAALQELAARDPANYWPRLVLGHIARWGLGDAAEAERRYQGAAAGFAARGDALGEVLARGNLYRLLIDCGRPRAATRQIDLAVAAATASQQPEALAWAWTYQASHLRKRGRDLRTALGLLLQAQELAFPEGPYRLRRRLLSELSNLRFELGHFDAALRGYDLLAELAEERRDGATAVNARFNAINTLLRRGSGPGSEIDREEVLRRARALLPLAEAEGGRRDLAQLHRTLAELLRNTEGGEPEVLEHYRRCIEIAEDELGEPRVASACLRSRAAFLAPRDAAAARRDMAAALALALEAGTAEPLLWGAREQMVVSWETRPRAEAVADSLRVLRVVEAYRELQADPSGRAEMFSSWTDPYYWLAGRLLDTGGAPTPRRDLDRAFEVVERMRARVLLDALQHSGAAPPTPSRGHPSMRRLEASLDRIARINLELLGPDKAEEDRARLQGELRRLEEGLAETGRELARASLPGLLPAGLATLEQVQAALAPDEALLAFQVAPWRDVYGEAAGGSWLLAISAVEVRAFRLPDRLSLERAVAQFRGLVRRRDGLEEVPAAQERLYRDLLDEALTSLPAGIDHLAIVPDGVLHLLPFGALRPAGDERPLARRFRLSVVPSATLWLHWRSRQPPAEAAAALALADPQPAAGGPATTAGLRSAACEPAVHPGRLPLARREGRSLVRRLGAPSRLLVGPEASESALKRADLRRYGLLHFAVHSLLCEDRPERSAILLSPGTDREDGLLQPREIAELPLEGKLVVLSACDSATGDVLQGEGVMSLARAFFQAGASAVIGTLWRLRDDEGAALFEAFYRHVGEGLSIGAALAAAQRDRIRAGAPASAWAGVVALGDAELVPVPGGRSNRSSRLWVLAPIAALAGAVAAFLLMRLRRRSRRARAI